MMTFSALGHDQRVPQSQGVIDLDILHFLEIGVLCS